MKEKTNGLEVSVESSHTSGDKSIGPWHINSSVKKQIVFANPGGSKVENHISNLVLLQK